MGPWGMDEKRLWVFASMHAILKPKDGSKVEKRWKSRFVTVARQVSHKSVFSSFYVWCRCTSNPLNMIMTDLKASWEQANVRWEPASDRDEQTVDMACSTLWVRQPCKSDQAVSHQAAATWFL